MFDNIYEAAAPLMEDWKEYISVVKENVEGYSNIEACQLAMVLENTKSEINNSRNRLNSTQPVSEATDISMINTFTSNVFDLVTAIFPNLLANDIVSVQPLDRRNGQIFYLKFKYGSDKGGISKGSNMLTSTDGFSGKDYSGERITGEELTISDGSVNHTLTYRPIKPGTVRIYTSLGKTQNDVPGTDGTGTFTASGDATNASNGTGSGTVNYATGVITLTGITASDLFVDWEYNLNDYSAKVGDIDVEVAVEPITARPRKLKSVYMFEVGYDIKQSFGLNMDDVILKATSGEIGYEIDGEIMGDLVNNAGSDSDWNKNPSYKGMDVPVHNLTFINAVNDASNTILSLTRRYEATFIICGKDAATVIESLGKDHFKRVATGGVAGGPHLVGILEDKYKVYKNPFYADNVALIGAKGEMFIESGYVYAPYLPLFASQLLVDSDFKAQRGFCTLYGKRMINSNMYHRIDLIDNTPANTGA